MNNGYCTIDFNGRQLGLKFGLEANAMFLNKFAEYPDETILSNYIGVKHISYLIYGGYVNNCMIKDEQPVIKPGQFAEWVEEMSIEEEGRKVLQHITDVYSQSKFTKSALKNVDEAVEEVKKKLAEQNQIESNLPVTPNSDAVE